MSAGPALPDMQRARRIGHFLHPAFRDPPKHSSAIWWAVIPVAALVSAGVRFADPTLVGIKSLAPVMVVWFVAIWNLRGVEFQRKLAITIALSFLAINVPAIMMGESPRVAVMQYIGASIAGYLIVALIAAVIGTLDFTRTTEMLQVLGFTLIGSAVSLPFQLLFVAPVGG
ncbi:MAG TPA: hypothetical protein PLO27_10830, partial [Marmoricola sp.]|nr:hypothetical protein [Marmoricola sp.]